MIELLNEEEKNQRVNGISNKYLYLQLLNFNTQYFASLNAFGTLAL